MNRKYIKEFAKYFGALGIYFGITILGTFFGLALLFARYRDFEYIITKQPYGLFCLGISSIMLIIACKLSYSNYDKFIKLKSSFSYIKYFLYGMAFNLILSFGLSPFLSEKTIQDSNDAAASLFIGNPIFIIITSALLVPIMEELVFRHFMLNNKFPYMMYAKRNNLELEQVLNNNKCFFINAVIQGLFFGLMHGNLLQGAYTCVLGIVFAYGVRKEKSLMASICMHSGLNFFAAITQVFPNSTVIVLLLGGIGVILLINEFVFRRFKK